MLSAAFRLVRISVTVTGYRTPDSNAAKNLTATSDRKSESTSDKSVKNPESRILIRPLSTPIFLGGGCVWRN